MYSNHSFTGLAIVNSTLVHLSNIIGFISLEVNETFNCMDSVDREQWDEYSVDTLLSV